MADLLTPEIVYRKWAVDGVPDSGAHKPHKSEIIQLLNTLFGVSRGGWVVAQTLGGLNAVTPEEETDGGVVLTGAGAGYYSRAAGVWVFGRGFPDTFAKVLLAGSGTAQTGAVGGGVTPASIEVFFAKVATANTGPMTLAIGGEPPRQVVNLAGNALSAGEWTGMVMFYLNDDGDYQLLIDAGAAASAAVSAGAASIDADRAEAAADAALGAVSSISPTEFPSRAWAIANLHPVVASDFVRTAGYTVSGDGGAALYKKVASEPSHAGKFSITLDDGVTVVWYEIAEAVRSPQMYGVFGDGSDELAGWNALVSMPGIIMVPPAQTHYAVSGIIVPVDGVFIDGFAVKPELRQISGSTATLFNLDGRAQVDVCNLTIKGGIAAGRTISMTGAVSCSIKGNGFLDLPSGGNGAIYVDVGANDNDISGNTVINCASTFIGLIGSGVHDNRVVGNSVTDCVGFGVFVAGGAHDNLVAYNKTVSNGIELVGVTRASHHNRVIGNHAEGCGDNGISITGERNLVVANVCQKNDLSGIALYGSFNTATGNICTSNNQVGAAYAGILIQAVFGGAGQYNAVDGNIIDDDQAVPTQNNGVRVLNSSYAAWAPGQVVSVGNYRVNGLHIYRAETAGTTGSTAPTHTSGTVSDGTVSWSYATSFLDEAVTSGNIVGDANVLGRSVSDRLFRQDAANNSALPAKRRRLVAASYSAVASDEIIGVTTSAARTITLPNTNRVVGQEILIKDESGQAATNNITVNGNGANIEASSSYTINTARGFVKLYWAGAAWMVGAKG